MKSFSVLLGGSGRFIATERGGELVVVGNTGHILGQPSGVVCAALSRRIVAAIRSGNLVDPNSAAPRGGTVFNLTLDEAV